MHHIWMNPVFVILKAFYPLVLILLYSYKLSISFHPRHIVRFDCWRNNLKKSSILLCRGLVEGLYYLVFHPLCVAPDCYIVIHSLRFGLASQPSRLIPRFFNMNHFIKWQLSTRRHLLQSPSCHCFLL